MAMHTKSQKNIGSKIKLIDFVQQIQFCHIKNSFDVGSKICYLVLTHSLVVVGRTDIVTFGQHFSKWMRGIGGRTFTKMWHTL